MVRKEFFVNFKYNPNIFMAIDQDLLLRSFKSINYFLIEQPLVFVHEPKKKKIFYKLNQLYVLFLTRLRFINSHKLYYYFTIVVFIFIISCIFYNFGLKTKKLLKTSNHQYQSLLNTIKQ